jgi:hypothetical protein
LLANRDRIISGCFGKSRTEGRTVPNSEECLIRKILEEAVAEAKDTVEGAKLAATGDKDLTHLLLESYARQRKAVRELEDHKQQHGCDK